MRRFELIVFDWDGTLMDSEARIVACIQAAIEDTGAAPLGVEAIRNIIGLGLREAVQALYPGTDETFCQQLADRYRAHFLSATLAPSAMFEGAMETLRALARQDYLLAVATGKGRRGLDMTLVTSGLADFFHATRCADETASKPSPNMLLELMDELGVMPAKTLMVGDTEYDMAMAANAGTAALAVSYGVHTPARLRAHAPLGCVHAITEVPAWLESAGR